MSRAARTAAAATYLDERLGSNAGMKGNLRKVFPEHWSFLLGGLALYSFLIVLLSGVYLTFFYVPSATEVVYDGSYAPLRGLEMTEAYASTLDLSFEVRGGLLMRQIHHWAALIFIAAIVLHLCRVFFTGAFRKPREFNWAIGVLLLILALVEGFAGYSLPDDLLSGTGLRITQGIVLAIPVVGTYLQFFLFGGEFPGEEIIPRLYTVHILLVPALMLGLVVVHLMLIVLHKHTNFPGPGRSNENVTGFPFFPVYMAKEAGFLFVVSGVCVLLGGLAQINPVWLYGPYRPDQISAGSQPDWYIGFLDGALRLFPNWETTAFGHTVSWNLLVPALVLPGLMFVILLVYPFLESWVTGDKREHHLLDRPRDTPVRTSLGTMALSFYLILFVHSSSDIIAITFDQSINVIARVNQVALFVVPPLVFLATKRICLGLQRRDRHRVLHGRETGVIKRLPTGEFIEVHEPLPAAERYTLTRRRVHQPIEAGPVSDAHGIPNQRRRRVRARLSHFWYADAVPEPTAEEYRAGVGSHTNGGSPGNGHSGGAPARIGSAAEQPPKDR